VFVSGVEVQTRLVNTRPRRDSEHAIVAGTTVVWIE